MAGSSNVAGDIGVDDEGLGETAGMAGICTVPGNRAAKIFAIVKTWHSCW